jgi:DNA-binding TFAR19-related protein (PDSD5 family)
LIDKEKSAKDDPDLELIKARKMKALKEQFAFKEKERKNIEQNEMNQKKIGSTETDSVSERNFLLRHLYDRGNEVLQLAEQQFPFQTKILVKRLNELIRYGEISRISGGDLLSIFRSIGFKIRVNTNISISDHGKTISFSDKLKQSNEFDKID